MTDWSQYLAYQCRHSFCEADCINPVDASCTQARECQICHRLPSTFVLEDEPNAKEPTASEPKGAPARPGAQRSEHPGPERERQSRSAPSRPAGSDPLRVDPEGRAHPPNPEGDGGNENSVTRATDSPAKPR